MTPAIHCDVLVIGGGAAGVAAAAAAGRAGARVALVERYGFLGGLATAAQVGTICGLYLRDSAGGAATPVANGFPLEFAARLQACAASKPIRVDRGLWVLPYVPHDFARVADAILAGAGNVTLILHGTVTEARAENARLREVRALAWNEPLTLRAAAVVDSTGEATVAALGGAAWENGGGEQAPALVFVLEDVDPGLAGRGLLEVRRELRAAVEAGALPALCERISVIPGSADCGRLCFKISLGQASGNLAAWEQVTEWERASRALLEPLIRFLRGSVAACRSARLASVAPQLGVRSGRRIVGRARLGDDDVLQARKSAAGAARGAWPMEQWGKGPRPEMTYFAERDYYDIPLDCLRPVELENVFVAGRCMSAMTGAMSSARVIGTALATGWAAGTAAAAQAAGSPPAQALEAIQKQLGTPGGV